MREMMDIFNRYYYKAALQRVKVVNDHNTVRVAAILVVQLDGQTEEKNFKKFDCYPYLTRYLMTK